jgi:protease-4
MIILGFMGSCTFMVVGAMGNLVQKPQEVVAENSILLLDLEGVILDGKKFLKDLRNYSTKDNIKGVLIRVNSPGGVVGPSQEIYQEIKRIKEDLGKPVYISASGLMASGAFYAAMGASKIYANKGSLLGSIGVIMNFANMEDLYSWAKIKRFNLTTGKFKDTGADFRAMRPEEKQYLEALLEESLNQFVNDIADGRKNLAIDKIRALADGRVFTGSFAKSYGFIDEVGTMQEAANELGEELGLGKNPKLFVPKKSPEEFFAMLSEAANQLNPATKIESRLGMELVGRPLYLFPQAAGR